MPADYLKPLGEAFFERGVSLEASICEHLRLLFGGVTFAADPNYSCRLDEWVEECGANQDDSLLRRRLKECLPLCDPRIANVEVEDVSWEANRCHLMIRLSMVADLRTDNLLLEANVRMHPFTVELQAA